MVTGQSGPFMVPDPKHAAKEPIQDIDQFQLQIKIAFSIKCIDIYKYCSKLNLACSGSVYYSYCTSIVSNS